MLKRRIKHLLDRRIGQTFWSPPAEPGAYLYELEVFDQVALGRHTRNIAVGLERISMWVSELIQTVLPIKPADAVAH